MPIRYILSISIAALILATFYINQIPKEGFNPSDDGMIVAQSYRILHGEIPHRDFITVKPALSGYIHTIDFVLPFSLFENGRFIILIEIFAAAVFWSMVIIQLTGNKFPKNQYCLLLLSSILTVFVLNLNTFITYPWTTIDGLTFSGIGAAIFMLSIHSQSKLKTAYLLLSIILMSTAALCRQNFLPMPFIGLTLLILLTKPKKSTIIIYFTVGLLPLLVYVLFMAWNGAVKDLILQLSCRKSLIGPGVITYITAFYKSRTLVIYIAIFFFTLKDFSRKTSIGLFITFVVLGTSLVEAFYLFRERDYYRIPFELFFLLLSYTVWSLSKRLIDLNESLISVFALSISWCASISIGINSPLMGLGFIGSTIAVYACLTLFRISPKHYSNKSTIITASIVFLSFCLFLFSTTGQKEFNYRDRPSRELNSSLGSLSAYAFGKISTNSRTYDYLKAIKTILDENPAMLNRSVFLPHHCALYPAFNTRNPFPLDWNDHLEYVGMEEEYHNRCYKSTDSAVVYLFIDKVNTDVLSDSIQQKKYHAWLHENILLFINKGEKLPFDNPFFDIYSLPVSKLAAK